MMGKTYYFLGFGVLSFLFISLMNTNKQTPVTDVYATVQTPLQVENLGNQLNFLAQFSLTAMQKIDNPGILDLTRELDSTYFELLAAFKNLTLEERYEVHYATIPEHRRQLHKLKSIRLESFEPAYVPMLITELEKLQQINSETLAQGSSSMTELQLNINQATQRYLNIAKELMEYQDQLF